MKSLKGTTRRDFIAKALTATAATMFAPTILAQSKTAPDYHGMIVGHGAYRYRVDLRWCRATPSTAPVTNCSEMVQAADGRLFMLTDALQNNVLIFKKDGALLDTWTLELPAAHGLTLVKEGGQEVLWIADFRGRVLKTSLEGKLLMELPTAIQCGAYEPGEKYAPTEVAVGPDGRIYVADGYGSQFILRFDAAGKYLGKFGGRSELEPGKFIQAHGIAIDTRESRSLLICTERMRNEFHWYTPEGEYVKSVYLPGAFVSRPVIRGDLLLTGVCLGMTPNDYRPKLKRGFVTILDRQNRVISNPGGLPPRYNDKGELLVMLQDQPVILHGHDVCVDDQGDLYVCQWNADRVYPYKFHRVS